MRIITLISLFCYLNAAAAVAPRAEIQPIDEARVAEIKAMLSDEPFCFAPPCSDREAWAKAMPPAAVKIYTKRANAVLAPDGTSTMEPWNPDWMDVYFNVPKTNDSQTGKDMNGKRCSVLSNLVLAECATGKGKYVSAANDALRKLVRQPIWTHPRNYRPNAKVQDIELAAQHYALVVAQSLYLLGDRIEPDLRKEAVDTLYAKVFRPFLETFVPGSKLHHGWLVGTNNWNSSCLSGILTAALAMDDKDLRARVATAAERYSYNYTLGYTDDGYCTEGMGYYNYGFDKYIVVREALLRATGGKIDIFKATHRVPAMMLYPMNMMMYADVAPVKNNYAAIGDCGSNKRPSKNIIFYNTKYLGIDEPSLRGYDPRTSSAAMHFDLLLRFTDFSTWKGQGQEFTPDPLRSYFSDAGILTVRPAVGSGSRMSVTMKGGHTAEHHNHNDVGSYSLCLDGSFLVEDPGIAPYTGVTFSKRRYTVKTINSYGHPVPTVDGALQKEGIRKHAPVLAADFSDDVDRFELEMKEFYTPAVADLSSLRRAFTYDRRKAVFEVRDLFSAEKKHEYETAFTTRGEVSVQKNVITITRDGKTLTATVRSDVPVVISTEQIGGTPNEAKVPFTRVSVKAKSPRQKAEISISYRPE